MASPGFCGLAPEQPARCLAMRQANILPVPQRKTFSHAISSYTQKIKTLGFAQECFVRSASMKPKLLLVAIRTTPGEEPFLEVSKEISALDNVFARRWYIQVELEPFSSNVLEGRYDCDVVHFACHGALDFRTPSNSHLILQKTESNLSQHVQDFLTVHQISEVNLKHPLIAYLSAWSTAENKVRHLADEVLHLASGFQVPGFGHVIASMWAAGDEFCVKIAESFYKIVAGTWDQQNFDESVARALHVSMESIQHVYCKKPLVLAQFVYTGA
jgi:CHAT domain-containing protein